MTSILHLKRFKAIPKMHCGISDIVFVRISVLVKMKVCVGLVER